MKNKKITKEYGDASEARMQSYIRQVRDEVKEDMQNLRVQVGEDMQTLRVQVNQDMERHAGALSEEFQGRLKGVAELVSHHAERFDNVDEKLETIVSNIQEIKVVLNTKADHEDLIVLKKRMSALELKAG